MPGHDSHTVQIFNSPVEPEDTQSRASEVINLLAQGLLRKLTDERMSIPAWHEPLPRRKDGKP